MREGSVIGLGGERLRRRGAIAVAGVAKRSKRTVHFNIASYPGIFYLSSQVSVKGVD